MRKKKLFTKEVQERVALILEPFKRIDEWKALSVPNHENPSAVILLTGLPGVGKTTLAEEIIREIIQDDEYVIPTLDFADVASKAFGETQNRIKLAFSEVLRKSKTRKTTKVPVLFMDEVDSLLFDRAMVKADNIHMMSIINTLLTCIDQLTSKGGVLVMATNFSNLLDAALMRRVTDTIHLEPLQGEDAFKLWDRLMPPPPFGVPREQIKLPKDVPYTPNSVEKAILLEARTAFLEGRNMQMEKINL